MSDLIDKKCYEITEVLNEINLIDVFNILIRVFVFYTVQSGIDEDYFNSIMSSLKENHVSFKEFSNSLKGKSPEEMLVLTMKRLAKDKSINESN